MPPPTLLPTREQTLQRAGYRRIAGIDEVGRGPLAGPVVAAAVILDIERIPAGLADSKVLTAARREELLDEILVSCWVGIGSVPAREIDRCNIRQATLLAMAFAADALPCRPDMALVDGNDPPTLRCPVQTIVKGDSCVPSIAAASIVAKVMRDRMMRRIGEGLPAFGFATNAGYGTAEHLAALAAYGPSPHHRHSFAPVRFAAVRRGA